MTNYDEYRKEKTPCGVLGLKVELCPAVTARFTLSGAPAVGALIPPISVFIGRGGRPPGGPIGADDSTGWTSPRPEEDSDHFSAIVVPCGAFADEPSLLATDFACQTR